MSRRQVVLAVGCLVLAFVASTSRILAAVDEESKTTSWTFSITGDKTRPVFSIWREQLENEPKWAGPLSCPPPLNVVDAVRIAHGEIGRYHSRFEGEFVKQVNLVNLEGGWWVYLVEWSGRNDDQQISVEIPVLLSGQPVKGENLR